MPVSLIVLIAIVTIVLIGVVTCIAQPPNRLVERFTKRKPD